MAAHTHRYYSVSLRELGLDLCAGNYTAEIGVYETEFKFQGLRPSIKQEIYLCMAASSFIIGVMAAG